MSDSHEAHEDQTQLFLTQLTSQVFLSVSQLQASSSPSVSPASADTLHQGSSTPSTESSSSFSSSPSPPKPVTATEAAPPIAAPAAPPPAAPPSPRSSGLEDEEACGERADTPAAL